MRQKWRKTHIFIRPNSNVPITHQLFTSIRLQSPEQSARRHKRGHFLTFFDCFLTPPNINRHVVGFKILFLKSKN